MLLDFFSPLRRRVLRASDPNDDAACLSIAVMCVAYSLSAHL